MKIGGNPITEWWHPLPFKKVILVYVCTATVGLLGLALVSLLFDVEFDDHMTGVGGWSLVVGVFIALWMKHKASRDQPDGSETDQ
jgi:hypothetical protein